MKAPGEWPDPPKPYDLVVFIGRLEPPTIAHYEIVSHALQYGKNVLILPSSANQPRTLSNPWTAVERAKMIRDGFMDDLDRIEVVGLEDKQNDLLWVREVQRIADKIVPPNAKIGIIGHSKDATSYYLFLFPQWDLLEMSNIDNVNATDVRNYYFSEKYREEGGTEGLMQMIPEPVAQYLKDFSDKEEYKLLVKEYDFIQKYRQQWAFPPHPVIFTTTDAVVVQSGHILLVNRRSLPGCGLWALPGGFLGYDERIVDSMIRELREETKLRVPVPILKGSIRDKEIFDNPKRSLRGRTVTHAFFIELPSGPLSKVKGSSDASSAKWIPLNKALNMGEQLFEDHLFIIKHFLGEA